MYKVLEVIALAAKEIAENGYIKEDKQTIKSVKQAVKKHLPIGQKWIDIATKSIAYYDEHADRSTFAYSVRQLIHKEEVELNDINRIAFIPYFYERGLEFWAKKALREKEQAERAKIPTEFYPAAVGTRVAFEGTVKAIKSLPMYEVVEIQHNNTIFVWFTSDPNLTVGQIINAKATIKAFQEYNGVKNTIVNRLHVAA